MKEDILEQLIDEFLMHQGYFTMHNVKFRPSKSHPDYISKQDSVASDIDVIGFNPLLMGADRVIVVSCKSWQSGFDPASKIAELDANKIVSGREAWRGFRELIQPKWAEAFIDAVERQTGTRKFEYWTAVTHIKNAHNRRLWEENPQFSARMEHNPIRLKSFRDLIDAVWRQLERTPAASELGRMVQLMKASGWTVPKD